MKRHRKSRQSRRRSPLNRPAMELFEVRAAAANLAFGVDDAAFSADVGGNLATPAEVFVEANQADVDEETGAVGDPTATTANRVDEPTTTPVRQTPQPEPSAPRRSIGNVDDQADITAVEEQ